MLPRLTSHLLAALATLPLALGCSADSTDDIPAPAPDAGEQENPDNVALTASADAVTTPWSTVMVTGSGPAQGTLIINSPARGEETRSLGSTGDFCVDVALSDGENMIKVEAINADGSYSDPVFLTVSKEGEPPEPQGQEEPGVSDRTDGATYYANADGGTVGDVSISEGAWEDLVDGDTGAYMTFVGEWAGNEAVAFKLSERMRVHGFEVTAPHMDGDSCGPQAFSLFVADGPEPEMAFDGINWVKVAEVIKEDAVEEGTTYRLDATFSTNATHFAIMGTNPTCSPWGYQNKYGFNEIRVLAQDESASEPVDQAPNCANSR